MLNNSISIKTNYVMFCTRSFPYLCCYSTILKRLANKSVNINQEQGTFLTNEFLDYFLNEQNLPLSKQIKRYEYINKKGSFVPPKICDLAKNNFVLFLRNNVEIIKIISSKSIKDNIKASFKKCLKYVSDNIDDIYKYGIDDGHINPRIVDKGSLKKTTIDLMKNVEGSNFELNKKVFDEYYKLIAPFKEELTKAYKSTLFVLKANSLIKSIGKIKDYFDTISIFTNDVKVIAVVSKSGVLNISLLKNGVVDSFLPSINYDSNNCNYLIEEAIEKSKQVTKTCNYLPKIFSFIDLNNFLGFKKRFPIYDDPNTSALPEYRNIANKKIANKLSNNKGIYLKFTVDDNYLSKDNISPMIYYDYFTLLVAFQHSYDEHTLWRFIQDSFTGGCNYTLYKEKINDFLQKPTEHLYFDDSLATVSAIDETVNINSINNFLKNRKNKVVKSAASHQIRIYSFWDFIYVCNALAVGSISLLVNSVFVEYIKEIVSKSSFKPLLNVKLAKLATVYSKIDACHNSSSYSSKEDSNAIFDIIFGCIGLTRSERFLNETANTHWRSGNLISSQTYQRYGIVFSLIGLITGIFSYGLISKVDTTETSASDYVTLFKKIFTESPKIPVVLTIASVPIVLWIVLNTISAIKIKYFENNIFKLCKYNDRKKSCND